MLPSCLICLHFSAPEALEVVYIEDYFFFVLRGRVGFVIKAAVARLWEQYGSDRLLALGLQMHGQYLHFTCTTTKLSNFT